MVRTPARRAGSHTSRCFWVRRAFVVACVSGALPATHPGATQTAIALWVLGQILLVLGFGEINRRQRKQPFGADCTEAGAVLRRLVRVPPGKPGFVVRLVGAGNQRPDLAAHVISLPTAPG